MPLVEAAHTDKKELVIPTSADIKRALNCADPSQADSELTDHMEFFLNVVFPAIEPKVMKAELWLARSCSHLRWFGPQRWAVEVATGMVFLDHFSDTDNIKHNVGIPEQEGPQTTKPVNKKKRKMQTAKLLHGLETKILENKEHCERLVMAEGFADRMLQWDRKCCKERYEKAQETAPRLENHVPPPLGAANNNPFEGSFLACLNATRTHAAATIAAATQVAEM